jgi:hypothetical protein
MRTVNLILSVRKHSAGTHKLVLNGGSIALKKNKTKKLPFRAGGMAQGLEFNPQFHNF